MELYPLLLLPEFSPRPWGATDLSPIYTGRKFAEKIGEAWLTGDECRVANGPLAGQRLADLAEKYGRELVGDAAREPKRFPLLLKFLFPHDKLSVQVHPDDASAQRVGQPWGKRNLSSSGKRVGSRAASPTNSRPYFSAKSARRCPASGPLATRHSSPVSQASPIFSWNLRPA